MAKIHSLKISNFRGIKNFEEVFGFNNLICITGKGGSGKTTILNAIYILLSSDADIKFKVSDFYKEETSCPIEIEAVLCELPVEITQSGNHSPVLTLKLIVKEDLKPHWFIIKEGKSIKLNTEEKKHLQTKYLIPTYEQLAASQYTAGLSLIDDIEIYLKPDEIQNTLISLSTQTKGHVIITTKSKDIIDRIKKEIIYII